ncbi:3-dehydroquinate dehydratase [Chlamydia trachomatis]|nr:3-dehydroquinate dehydratase [Chlamydia trachomatis]
MEQSYATMSMGNLGKLSRLAGVLTGSCWSFASLDEASAPGQISLTNMKKFLEELEN